MAGGGIKFTNKAWLKRGT